MLAPAGEIFDLEVWIRITNTITRRQSETEDRISHLALSAEIQRFNAAVIGEPLVNLVQLCAILNNPATQKHCMLN